MSHASDVLFHIPEPANILPALLRAHKQPSASLFTFLSPENVVSQCAPTNCLNPHQRNGSRLSADPFGIGTVRATGADCALQSAASHPASVQEHTAPGRAGSVRQHCSASEQRNTLCTEGTEQNELLVTLRRVRPSVSPKTLRLRVQSYQLVLSLVATLRERVPS